MEKRKRTTFHCIAAADSKPQCGAQNAGFQPLHRPVRGGRASVKMRSIAEAQ
jgi:hypothetical protein